jgi:hypothetical protein
MATAVPVREEDSLPIFAIYFYGGLAVGIVMSILAATLFWTGLRERPVAWWMPVVACLLLGVGVAAFWWSWSVAHMHYGPGP